MTTLLSYFGNIKLTQDQNNALTKLESFLESDKKIFVLGGYAGTGKTTILRGVVNYLSDEEHKKNVVLTAPTGRATKVLSSRTGYDAFTIHRTIYAKDCVVIKNQKSEDFAEREFTYVFPLQEAPKEVVVIVDEASMLTDKESHNELFQFGSGHLLTDLIKYSRDGKIIFVGDVAQLPPVGDTHSAALDVDSLSQLEFGVDSYVMTEVVRQSKDNQILNNAIKVRDLLEKPRNERNELVFETKQGEVETITADGIVNCYVDDLEQHSYLQTDSKIICYSNRLAGIYNQHIRQRLYSYPTHVMPNDLLMIVQNNYNLDVFNGDIIRVISVSDNVEKQSAPVYVKRFGERVRETITLTFRDVELQNEFGKVFSCKIIDSFLESSDPHLPFDDMKALLINFCMRMDECGIKEGTLDFVERMKSDPYLNALRVKYGYAITCHKAQGGEWNKVYVDFTDRLGLSDDYLRWIYTATTRASKTLYGLNLPNITALSKLQFNPIQRVSKAPADLLDWSNYPSTPFHSESSLGCKRAKYFEIEEKLSQSSCKIERVKSNPYMEEYYISTSNGVVRFDVMHDASGIFKSFKTAIITDENKQLLELLNSDYVIDSKLDYQPSTDSFNQLFQFVLAAASELDIKLINVVESIPNYYITYLFKTSGQFSYIQFFFNGSHQITRAMPKSDLGEQDEKLQQLILKLS